MDNAIVQDQSQILGNAIISEDSIVEGKSIIAGTFNIQKRAHIKNSIMGYPSSQMLLKMKEYIKATDSGMSQPQKENHPKNEENSITIDELIKKYGVTEKPNNERVKPEEHQYKTPSLYIPPPRTELNPPDIKHCTNNKDDVNYIAYWTIKRVQNDRVFVDFGQNVNSYNCYNSNETVVAFSKEGKVVPLKFIRVTMPTIIQNSKACDCIRKDDAGKCIELNGRDYDGLDIANSDCDFEGEYQFDPSNHLAPYTMAIKVDDTKSIEFWPVTNTRIYADSPEAKEIALKKIGLSRDEAKGILYYTQIVPSKTCTSAPCGKFVSRLVSEEYTKPNIAQDLKSKDYEDIHGLLKIGDCIISQSLIICNDRYYCKNFGYYHSGSSDINPIVQGKIKLKGTEYFIINYQSSWTTRKHMLFAHKEMRMANYTCE